MGFFFTEKVLRIIFYADISIKKRINIDKIIHTEVSDFSGGNDVQFRH